MLLTGVGLGLFILGTGGAGLLLAGAGAGLLGEGIFAGALISGGISAASIIRAANADPYFVVADTRPNADPIGVSGVQITRVTGGLIPTPPASPAPSIGASGALTESVAGGTGIPAFSANSAFPDGQPYDDDPVPFMGGALPAGVQAIGEWTWDSGKKYGAMLSHTQTASDGPQIHYFLNATSSHEAGAGYQHRAICVSRPRQRARRAVRAVLHG